MQRAELLGLSIEEAFEDVFVSKKDRLGYKAAQGGRNRREKAAEQHGSVYT